MPRSKHIDEIAEKNGVNVQSLEEIAVEIVEFQEATVDEVLHLYAPSLADVFSKHEGSIRIVIGSNTRLIGCRAQGRWLLVLVTTLCLIGGLLLFDVNTVVTLLRLLLDFVKEATVNSPLKFPI